jgi:hypothetical protein
VYNPETVINSTQETSVESSSVQEPVSVEGVSVPAKEVIFVDENKDNRVDKETEKLTGEAVNETQYSNRGNNLVYWLLFFSLNVFVCFSNDLCDILKCINTNTCLL